MRLGIRSRSRSLKGMTLVDQTNVILWSVVVATVFVLGTGALQGLCVTKPRYIPLIISVVVSVIGLFLVWGLYRTPNFAIHFVEGLHLETIVLNGLPLSPVHIAFIFGLFSLTLLIWSTGGTVHSVFAPLYVAFAAIINILIVEALPTRLIMSGSIFLSAVILIHPDDRPGIKGGTIGPSWLRVLLRKRGYFSFTFARPSYYIGYYALLGINILFAMGITTFVDWLTQ